MLHAVIRWDGGAFHFIGEATPYNLQTLRQHVGDRVRDGNAVRVSVDLDAEDSPALFAHAGKWLSKLRRAGSDVEVAIAGQPARVGARAGNSRSGRGRAAAG